MTALIRQAVAALERDPLRNIVLLKTLAHYPQAVECRIADDGAGVLVLLPGAASAWDRLNYPGADRVVLMAASDPAAARELLRYVPRNERLVFKLHDARHVAAVMEAFALERVNAFVSYTPPQGRRWSAPGDVTVSHAPGEACLDIYARLGHSRDELRPLFASGAALSFTLFEGDAPRCSCFTYPNYGPIHEIGGLYTDPAHRRRGLARRVVEAALAHLADAGLTARYQVQENNRASAALAEAIGLTPIVTYEHWRHKPAATGQGT